MKGLGENAKLIVWIIERVGISLLVSGFLAWQVYVKFAAMEKSMKQLNRNQGAMMKKMGIQRVPPPDSER